MSKNEKYHHGDLRNSLIQTAIKLLEQGGIGALKMREIGRTAGVSQSAAYRHFNDKAALLVAIARLGFDELAEELQAIRLNEQLACYDRLSRMGEAYIVYAVEHSAQYRLMFGNEAIRQDEHPDLYASARKMAHEVYHMVRLCQNAGEVKGETPQEILQTIWSVAHGAAMLVMDGFLEVDDLHLYASQIVGHVCNGIRKTD